MTVSSAARMGNFARVNVIRMLQTLRADAVARQYSVSAEIQRLDDLIATFESGENNMDDDVTMTEATGTQGGN